MHVYLPEFFWFPNRGSEEGFYENCWNNDGDKKDTKLLNSQLDHVFQVQRLFKFLPLSIHLQDARGFLFELAVKILKPLTLLPSLDGGSKPGWLRYLFNKALSAASLNALPAPEKPFTTPVSEAIHFQRGLHYFIVQVNS